MPYCKYEELNIFIHASTLINTAEDLIQMVPIVEAAKYDELDDGAEHDAAEGGEHDSQEERSGKLHQGGREKRAQHVEGAMRQIDQVHDAEDERQPGGDQEQHDAELKAIQELFDQEQEVHRR